MNCTLLTKSGSVWDWITQYFAQTSYPQWDLDFGVLGLRADSAPSTLTPLLISAFHMSASTKYMLTTWKVYPNPGLCFELQIQVCHCLLHTSQLYFHNHQDYLNIAETLLLPIPAVSPGIHVMAMLSSHLVGVILSIFFLLPSTWTSCNSTFPCYLESYLFSPFSLLLPWSKP